ncbi:CLUMA_CG000696, isoform A [Clunio marinus]|uniref:CLUMA_CG000696, isoform A n=1 Tax=Clunio marinus TaxID=568069 RepID=A0A1J1HFW6_9DIPT|nr:CLUMA_CG000696, isoform A [Clunio marinus]
MKPFFNHRCATHLPKETEVLNLLYQEIKNSQNSFPSSQLKSLIESYSRDARRDLMKKEREGGCPLFYAAKLGNCEAVEYLVTNCDADMEQRNIFEVHEEKTFHYSTPLWVAAVANKLPVVKLLVRLGANMNSISDSGSTAVRSACFMTNVEVVEFLVEAGANFKLPNFNGGTCLINSVQSIELCNFLISKGADVNARDIQNKTALHYAIQEHRLETTQLLIEHGANPFTKSRYGDDALQTACLRGANEIFEYLRSKIYYSPDRIANALELLGSTILTGEQHLPNESQAIVYWRQALEIRTRENVPKNILSPREVFNNIVEFTTVDELNSIAMDLDDMRIQSLIISERILGLQHKDFLFRLLYRGAFFADSMRYDGCLKLWILSLEIRVEKNTLLHSDTVFVTQAIVRLMLNLNLKDSEFIPFEVQGQPDLPSFEEIYKVFRLLTDDITEAKRLLSIRPVYKKQQDNFDKMLKCITHLIYLMLATAGKCEEKLMLIHKGVYKIMKSDIRTSNQDTLLHMCVSRLNYVKHGYFADHNMTAKSVFPNIDVVKLLLNCNANVNARNECRSTPLFIASIPYNYNFELIETLLKVGAEMDYPNRTGDRPLTMFISNPLNNIPIMNYLTLKCLAATCVVKYRIPYRNLIPKTLETFVQDHE